MALSEDNQNWEKTNLSPIYSINYHIKESFCLNSNASGIFVENRMRNSKQADILYCLENISIPVEKIGNVDEYVNIGIEYCSGHPATFPLQIPTCKSVEDDALTLAPKDPVEKVIDTWKSLDFIKYDFDETNGSKRKKVFVNLSAVIDDSDIEEILHVDLFDSRDVHLGSATR